MTKTRFALLMTVLLLLFAAGHELPDVFLTFAALFQNTDSCKTAGTREHNAINEWEKGSLSA